MRLRLLVPAALAVWTLAVDFRVLMPFDRAIVEVAGDFADDRLDLAAALLVVLGSGVVTPVLAVALAGWAVVSGRRRLAAATVVVFGLLLLGQAGLRVVVPQAGPEGFSRARPDVPISSVTDYIDDVSRLALGTASNWLGQPADTVRVGMRPTVAVRSASVNAARTSYPSGHVARLTFLGGLVAVQLGARRTRLARWTTRGAIGAIAVGSGLSMVYFGHHWASDLVGGGLLGLLGVVVVSLVGERGQVSQSRD